MAVIVSLLRSRAGAVGLMMLALVVAAMLLVPRISPYDPLGIDFSAMLQPPSAGHWFGTDNFGRDIFTRVLAGAATDLRIALVCVLVPAAFGILVGLVAGYFGGRVDAVLMRLTDIVWAFPFYVLVLAIVGVLGPSERNLYIAFFLVNWIGYARITRGETQVVARLDFVDALRVLRFSDGRILGRHLLPNTIGPALVYAMSDIILTVQAVAALSFFGLGVQPPVPEWGLQIVESIDFMRDAPWMTIFPGLGIAYVGVAFSLIGDGLAAALRPKG